MGMSVARSRCSRRLHWEQRRVPAALQKMKSEMPPVIRWKWSEASLESAHLDAESSWHHGPPSPGSTMDGLSEYAHAAVPALTQQMRHGIIAEMAPLPVQGARAPHMMTAW